MTQHGSKKRDVLGRPGADAAHPSIHPGDRSFETAEQLAKGLGRIGDGQGVEVAVVRGLRDLGATMEVGNAREPVKRTPNARTPGGAGWQQELFNIKPGMMEQLLAELREHHQSAAS